MNPHFDEGLVVWKDEYSGRYSAPEYDSQFEKQWSLALQSMEWAETPGSSTQDPYIADRIYEWVGERPGGSGFHDPGMGSRKLDISVPRSLILGKKCLDLCCGVGRWTRVMQALGAGEVLSTDMSESALKGVSRYNANTRRVDLMTLPQEHPDMVGRFDFVNCWGVVMCTHDPRLAFANAAATVAPGGSLFIMAYAPEGLHGYRLTNVQRKIFHSLNAEERLAFVDDVWSRKWDRRYPLVDNLLNVTRKLRGVERGYKIAVLDMLAPEYNWVIPLDTLKKWMTDAGFQQVLHLNHAEHKPCAYHVLGVDRKPSK